MEKKLKKCKRKCKQCKQCKQCKKNIYKLNSNAQLYCSIKCYKKNMLTKKKDKVMSKLCPRCKKVYIYIGSKRCMKCQSYNKYGKLSQHRSKDRYKLKKRLERRLEKQNAKKK